MSWQDSFQPDQGDWRNSFQPDAPDNSNLSFWDNLKHSVVGGSTKAGLATFGLGVDAADKVGAISPESAAKARTVLSGAYNDVPSKYPTTPGVTNFIGETLANPTNYTPFGPILGGVASAAGQQLMNTDPSAPVLEKAKNAGIAGAEGGATGFGLSALFGKAANYLKPTEKKYADELISNGVSLNPSQLTSNPAFNIQQSAFKKFPVLSDLQAKADDKQLTQFTQAALSKAGIKFNPETQDISDELGKAYKHIGGSIGLVTSKYNMPVDSLFVGDVSKAQDEYLSQLNHSERGQFNEWVDKLTDPNKAVLTGKDYQTNRSALGNISKGKWTTDPNAARAYDALQDAMDNAMQRQLSPSDAAGLATYRQQYGALKTLMRANTLKSSVSGQLTPSAVFGAAKANNPNNISLGGNGLADLAKAGVGVLESKGEPLGSQLAEAGVGMGAAMHFPKAAAAVGTGLLPLQALYNKAPNYMVNGVPRLNDPRAILFGSLAAGNYMGGANQ